MAKRWMSPIQRAWAEGSRAAAREHVRLGLDLSRRIDVFGVIESAGVWLMFQPLKGLYGAYERIDHAAGMIINAHHPLSLQRFTAAHEYGHHVLGHQASLDGADQVHWTGAIPDARNVRPADLQEAAAQAFAASFLMPLQIVNAVLQQEALPARPGDLSPRQAYLLALEMGVSYTALVTHLTVLGKLDPRAAAELRRRGPKEVKREIGRGTRPQDPWADAWPLEQDDAGKTVFPRVDDELRISLPESPSTGYIWACTAPTVVDRSGRPSEGNSAGVTGAEDVQGDLALVESAFEPRAGHPDPRYGAGGLRHFAFRVLRPGQHTLRLVRRRPWQLDAGADTFEVRLVVSPKRTGVSDYGLSEHQKPLVAAA